MLPPQPWDWATHAPSKLPPPPHHRHFSASARGSSASGRGLLRRAGLSLSTARGFARDPDSDFRRCRCCRRHCRIARSRRPFRMRLRMNRAEQANSDRALKDVLHQKDTFNSSNEKSIARTRRHRPRRSRDKTCRSCCTRQAPPPWRAGSCRAEPASRNSPRPQMRRSATRRS